MKLQRKEKRLGLDFLARQTDNKRIHMNDIRFDTQDVIRVYGNNVDRKLNYLFSKNDLMWLHSSCFI